jgi:hypothetical protein
MPVVSLLGKTLEYPDGPCVPNHPAFEALKQLIEEEFFVNFDTKLNITNWDYILSRAKTHHVLANSLG